MSAAGTRLRSTDARARSEMRLLARPDITQRARDLRTAIEQSSGLLTPGKRVDPSTTNQILARTAVLLDEVIDLLGGQR